jgi:hypothetical protein
LSEVTIEVVPTNLATQKGHAFVERRSTCNLMKLLDLDSSLAKRRVPDDLRI